MGRKAMAPTTKRKFRDEPSGEPKFAVARSACTQQLKPRDCGYRQRSDPLELAMIRA